ncbi:MAG TPA: hypothetical protein VFG91_01770 [Woeseiaceae bacterium]|nr:hypothetical protein [Woeseiaceae bacterium]
MSTQLSENTIKVKLADLRKHCRDLLEEPAPPLPRPQPDGVREDAAPRERRA